MIIVKLQGGLGNQMFQYATAFTVAKRRNYKLKLDTSFYRNTPNRIFTLNNFQISAQTIKVPSGYLESIIKKVIPSKYLKRLNLFPPYSKIVIKEKSLEYDPSVFELPDNIYLDGYWQSEKYFFDYHDEITKEFTFKHLPDTINDGFAKDILNTNSVSLHIRRGDYISCNSNKEIYSQCTVDYYQNAVKYIADRIKNPVFYIFSDDADWALQNLNINFPIIFITQNRNKEHEDLRLMTLCKHNIIANSTFSWWGAWLNRNPEKIVIAPAQWFVNGDKIDIIPPGWITI